MNFFISFYNKMDKQSQLQRFQSYVYMEIEILAKLAFLEAPLLCFVHIYI